MIVFTEQDGYQQTRADYDYIAFVLLKLFCLGRRVSVYACVHRRGVALVLFQKEKMFSLACMDITRERF